MVQCYKARDEAKEQLEAEKDLKEAERRKEERNLIMQTAFHDVGVGNGGNTVTPGETVAMLSSNILNFKYNGKTEGIERGDVIYNSKIKLGIRTYVHPAFLRLKQ